MALAAIARPNYVDGTRFGIDSHGRVVATKRILLKITGTPGSDVFSASVQACLAALPAHGEVLISGSPASATNPYVIDISVEPVADDPKVFVATVEYGYQNLEVVSQDDDDGDEPDVDRERYPWEQNADISIDISGGREVVPEGGWYNGCLTLAQVQGERGTSGALDFSGETYRALLNTAGDPFKDPPTKMMRTGNLSIGFALLTDKGWGVTNFLDSYLHKVNIRSFVIGAGAESVTGSFTVPAGCAQVVGFNCVSRTLTETKKWRPGKEHPFGKKKGLTVIKNTTKTELTAYRYTPYYDVSISLEYREEGYLHYITNLGMRERVLAFVPYRYVNGGYVGSGTVTTLRPILNADQEITTEPRRLDDNGVALPEDASIDDVYFLKYRYYGYADFSGFIDKIPWEPEVVEE